MYAFEMAYYAHAVIEDGDDRYERGTQVPKTVEGFDELVAGGAIGEGKPDPVEVNHTSPDTIEIDGEVYEKRASDGAKSGEESA